MVICCVGKPATAAAELNARGRVAARDKLCATLPSIGAPHADRVFALEVGEAASDREGKG